jgi:hypothetical protein
LQFSRVSDRTLAEIAGTRAGPGTHHDVQPAKLVHGPLDDRLDLVLFAYITPDCDGLDLSFKLVLDQGGGTFGGFEVDIGEDEG